MINRDELIAIFDRVVQGTGTPEEIGLLRRSLRMVGDQVQFAPQDGSVTINIGTIAGGNVQIGDRSYQVAAIEEALKAALKEANRAERPNAERQLLAATKDNIEIRLDQSLHNDVLISLRKSLQPKQVEPLWRPEIMIGDKPPEAIAASTSILEVFDRVKGKLLILGSPGSGKTTTMLELAQKLVERAAADANYPIPVVFNLSSWGGKKQSLQSWIIEQLKDFPSSNISKNLLEQGKLLPILDGLDELKAELQADCITAINQELLRGRNPLLYLVVCSRSREYANHQIKLSLNGAIRLQKLTNPQIENYLSTIGQSQLWQKIKEKDKLLRLICTPLLLNIAILTYKKISFARWKSLSSAEAQLEYLLNAYIKKMLDRSPGSDLHNRYKSNTQRTQKWISFLASQMSQESQTEFLIEKMSPQWLETRTQKWIYSFLLQVFQPYVWLFAGIVGLSFGWTAYLTACLIALSYLALLLLIAVNSQEGSPFKENIEPVETLDWSYKRAESGLRNSLQGLKFLASRLLSERSFEANSSRLKLSVVLGLSTAIFVYNYGSMLALTTLSLASSLTLCIILLLAFCIFLVICVAIQFTIDGLVLRLDINKRKTPNRGIRNSAAFAGIIGLVGAVMGLLMILSFEEFYSNGASKFDHDLLFDHYLLFNYYLSNEEHSLSRRILFTVIGGIFGWTLSSAGGACIQHFALRLTLYYSGLAPWNYARFLNYCTERRIIQRIGGRYQFIHKLLQDHFAAMPIGKYEKKD